jgi:hypothetical protein
MLEAVGLERDVLIELNLERVVFREILLIVDEITDEPINEEIVVVQQIEEIQMKLGYEK